MPESVRYRTLLIGLLVLLVIASVAVASAQWYAQRSLAAHAERALEQLRVHDDTLQAVIERYRPLPSLIALDPEVRDALRRAPLDADTVHHLNRKLERINGAVSTSTLTLLDASGTALAASNWRNADSNVGFNYGFRPYFQRAAAEGRGRYYALGVTTAVPGYFLSEAVLDVDGNLLGVVVIKLLLSEVEAGWASLPDAIFVSDGYDTIFLSGRPAWRYHRLRPLLDSERRAIEQELPYGEVDLPLLDYRPHPGSGTPRRVRIGGDDKIWVSRVLPQGWTLHLLRSTAPMMAAARTTGFAVAAALLALALLTLALVQQRRLARLRERSRDELEGLVRQHAEEMRSAQDSLVQAARRADFGESPSLQHLPQGVCVIDGDLRLVAWNRRYIELFRFPPELIRVGRPIEDVFRYNAARGLLGPGPVEEAIQRRLDHLRSGRPHMHEREDSDGTVIEIRGNPLPGGGFVTSYADITAYKQTARDLRSLADTLERRIEQRTHDLAEAKAEAERANRYKTRFVAAAVHDLAQPLNAARMFVSALRERRDADPQQVAALIDGIDGALGAQDEILASLLDISRLESGALEVRRGPLPLAPLLDGLARETAVIAESRGLRFRYRPSTAWVDSDETLLRRILQNFLANALRYTRRGGILLAVRREGADLRIEVWDTGPGIAEAQHQRIFEEFRRLDTGDDQRERGAGLGLAIVERIARLLDHRISLRSRPGHGSVFAVSLPRAQAAATAATAVAAPRSMASPLRGRRIWCIDDDPHLRSALQTLLQGWGCTVVPLASAEQALAEPGPPPDLLLLDVRLGDDHGPDLVPHLQARWSQKLPVILLTAERDDALRAQALAAGWGWLGKPVAPAALRALISQWLVRAAG